MKEKMSRFLFGKTKDGKEVFGYRCENDNGLKVVFIEFGAIIQNITFPDKNGQPTDIVLGYDNLLGYEDDPYFFGCVVGRNANRIAKGEFTINGITYQMDQNEHELNNLHSGYDFYNKRVWASENTDVSVTFKLHSPDGDQHFPGNMDISVTYEITESNSILMTIKANTDADTICNLTNHTYMNMNGEGNGTIMEHTLLIPASNVTTTDDLQIPDGKIVAVEDTPFDFRTEKKIARDAGSNTHQLTLSGGYDHNFCIDGSGKRLFAKMRGDITGICLTMESDLPGLQFYAGNFIGNQPSQPAKSNHVYGTHSGFALEPQFYPNAVNIPSFESPILKAGEEFISVTEYKLSV